MKLVFTDEQAVDIRQRVLAGEKQVDLAREFHVNPTSINKIVKGRTYTGAPRRCGPVPAPIDPVGRSCKKCGEFKEWDAYSPTPRGLNGRRADCKACCVLRTSTLEARRKVADQRLRRQYGITLAEFEKMLAAQGSTCALCRRPERAKRNGSIPRLHVDHDHACCPGSRSCGKCLRGLLCNHCNRLAGALDAAPFPLERFVAYARRSLVVVV